MKFISSRGGNVAEKQQRYVIFGKWGETGQIGLTLGDLHKMGLTPESEGVHLMHENPTPLEERVRQAQKEIENRLQMAKFADGR